MNYQIPPSQKSFKDLVTHEQLEQIIAAISNGRYSWACVLILRFVGYNPLHFIPQRTYSRLIKEHSQVTTAIFDSKTTVNSLFSISDSQEVNYLATSDTKQINIQGVDAAFYLKSNLATLNPSKLEELQN